MKIYIASSWSNPYLDAIVSILRDRNHEVHDFRATGATGATQPAPPPFPGAAGSGGNRLGGPADSLDSVMSYLHLTSTQNRYQRQCAALVEAEVLLCVLPCGRSAHVEIGMALGLSIPVVLVHDGIEPDLMHLGVDAVVGLNPPGAGEFPSRKFQADLADALAMARDSQARGRTWYGNFLEYTIDGSNPPVADAGTRQEFPERRFGRRQPGNCYSITPPSGDQGSGTGA